MDNQEKYDEVFEALETASTYAGSFYSKLADAALAADPTNQERILKAFPELLKNYGPESSFQKRKVHLPIFPEITYE